MTVADSQDADVPTVRDVASPEDDPAPAFSAGALIRIAGTALAAGLLWIGEEALGPVAHAIGLAVLAVAGWPMLREAVQNLVARRMTMELSMSIAVVAAAAIGEFFTSLVVLLFVLVAEELERLTLDRGRRAIRSLLEFIPREARVRSANDVATVPVDSLTSGAVVLVVPGEAVPVDGTVVAGRSAVDQSRITGESALAEKEPGDPVFAGSINHAGAIDVRVEKVGRDTSYGRIVEAVESAGRSRAPVQRLADRLAGHLVQFAFAAAAITYLITGDLRDTISVVIVAGACGIAAGTPLAILGGIGRAARLGSIVKGGRHLEMLGRVDTVVLDKTGTLTFGEPSVVGVTAVDGVAAADVLRLAAAAELRSEHPLARAVVARAVADGLAPPEPAGFTYTVGRGVTAEIGGRTVLVGNARLLEEAGIAPPPPDDSAVGSEILVAADGRYLGRVLVADRVRPEAAAAMAGLAALGIRTLLLTGDVARVADAVGRELGITTVEAGLLPEDKLRRVTELTASGRVVAMVGDGINDAPALSQAAIGIAMGSGTDVAKESADVMLIGNDLTMLVETIRIARATRAIIWQNFSGTLLVDAIGMALAATGRLDPMSAAFIHVTSELVFLANSARLLVRPGDRAGRH